MHATTPDSGPSLGSLIAEIVSGRTLPADAAEIAFRAVMEGRATPVQMAALLAALRTRGEAPSEVAGGVRALRHAMVPVPVTDGTPVVDTCGTGGGALVTFNISTAAALLAAAAGVRIAKHGNRSFSSRCGSADVLEALGVEIDLTPEQLARILDRAGIVFMFAPRHHPAMRHVAPVRRELGIPTIMNVLGPLTNPAGSRRQVVGVADPANLPLLAEALLQLGHERALVVHGQPGMDEFSPLGPTDVLEIRDGALRRFRLDPAADLGWSGFDAAELAGGDPACNARIVEGVLAGRIGGAARAAVLLNAGAAIYVGGLAESIREGIDRAAAAIEEGVGLSALERLRQESRAAARS